MNSGSRSSILLPWHGKKRTVHTILAWQLHGAFCSEKAGRTDMRLQFRVTSSQRSWGAMFSKDLKEDILVFVYPNDAPHTFHTFFCPPLRMIAVSDDGQILFD